MESKYATLRDDDDDNNNEDEEEEEEEEEEEPSDGDSFAPTNEEEAAMMVVESPGLTRRGAQNQNSLLLFGGVGGADVGGIPALEAVDGNNEEEEEEGVVCNICCDNVPALVPAACGHQFCANCWTHYLTDKVADGKTLDLGCMQTSCARLLSPDEIRNFLPNDWEEKYNKFSRNARLLLDPTARWCPTPDCDTVLFGSAQQPRLVCTACENEICFKCSEPWHGRDSCERAANRVMSAYERENQVKKCPNCQAPTERITGCNHMTCSRCFYQWCWLCRGRYTANHFSPLNLLGCPGLQDGSLTFVGDDRFLGFQLGSCCGKFKRLLLRLLLSLFYGIGFVVLGPILLVLSPFIYLVLVIRQRHWQRIYRQRQLEENRARLAAIQHGQAIGDS